MDPITLERVKSKFNLKVIIISLVFLFVLAVIFRVLLVKPFLEPLDLNITNTTDTSVSISWTTLIPTEENLFYWKGDKFVFIPMGIPKIEDDKKDIQPNGQILTHHITLGGLEPNTNYHFRIYSNFMNVYDGQFTTAGPIEDRNPHPIYGNVIDSANRPIIGALVYFQVRTGAETSAVLSTYTNLQGGWSLDLNKLRDAGLGNRFESNNLSRETILINTGTASKTVNTTIDFDEPWPTIIVGAER